MHSLSRGCGPGREDRCPTGTAVGLVIRTTSGARNSSRRPAWRPGHRRSPATLVTGTLLRHDGRRRVPRAPDPSVGPWNRSAFTASNLVVSPGPSCPGVRLGRSTDEVPCCHDNERRTECPRSLIPPRRPPSSPGRSNPPAMLIPHRARGRRAGCDAGRHGDARGAFAGPSGRPDRVQRGQARSQDHSRFRGIVRGGDLQAADHPRGDHAGSRLHQHRVDHLRRHLHRRRRRHPALPRIPDRAAGQVVELHRDQLPADPRRAADVDRAGRVHPTDQPAHHAARGPQAVLRRVPAGRAPDAGAVQRGQRAVDLLSGRARPVQSRAGGAVHRPAAGEAADHRGLRVQEVRRAAAAVPGQLARPGGELPADVLRLPGGAVRGQPETRARAGPAADPARRPRAELLDLDGPAGRLLERQPVRVDLRRHQRTVRPAARRRQPGGAGDAGEDRARRAATSTPSSSGSRTRSPASS